jgi:hypothetical protein
MHLSINIHQDRQGSSFIQGHPATFRRTNKHVYRWNARHHAAVTTAQDVAARAVTAPLGRGPSLSGPKSVIVEQLDGESPSNPFIAHLVKLDTIHAIPSFIRPWEVVDDVRSVSSGFIIDLTKRWILTTAGKLSCNSPQKICQTFQPPDVGSLVCRCRRLRTPSETPAGSILPHAGLQPAQGCGMAIPQPVHQLAATIFTTTTASIPSCC